MLMSYLVQILLIKQVALRSIYSKISNKTTFLEQGTSVMFATEIFAHQEKRTIKSFHHSSLTDFSPSKMLALGNYEYIQEIAFSKTRVKPQSVVLEYSIKTKAGVLHQPFLGLWQNIQEPQTSFFVLVSIRETTVSISNTLVDYCRKLALRVQGVRPVLNKPLLGVTWVQKHVVVRQEFFFF